MDWLENLGTRFFRLNGDDLGRETFLSFSPSTGRLELCVDDDELRLPLEEVRAIWYRRWLNEQDQGGGDLLDARLAGAHKLHHDVSRHLSRERSKTAGFLFSQLANAWWLSHPDTASPNKPQVLAQAAAAGLDVPATLLTTDRGELQRFAETFGRVVTKPIGELQAFFIEGRVEVPYTAEISRAEINQLPERFAVSLFQERLEKAFEIRVFYLAGECYAMAIFSQLDGQTQQDFRQYNWQKPNRFVPYRLAPATAGRIVQLMETLQLDTGSVDLIRTPDGREVFLEVNPVGQFGMVSQPCNYHLERKVAELLVERAGHVLS